jgi:hypothetical protein
MCSKGKKSLLFFPLLHICIGSLYKNLHILSFSLGVFNLPLWGEVTTLREKDRTSHSIDLTFFYNQWYLQNDDKVQKIKAVPLNGIQMCSNPHLIKGGGKPPLY